MPFNDSHSTPPTETSSLPAPMILPPLVLEEMGVGWNVLEGGERARKVGGRGAEGRGGGDGASGGVGGTHGPWFLRMSQLVRAEWNRGKEEIVHSDGKEEAAMSQRRRARSEYIRDLLDVGFLEPPPDGSTSARRVFETIVGSDGSRRMRHHLHLLSSLAPLLEQEEEDAAPAGVGVERRGDAMGSRHGDGVGLLQTCLRRAFLHPTALTVHLIPVLDLANHPSSSFETLNSRVEFHDFAPNSSCQIGRGTGGGGGDGGPVAVLRAIADIKMGEEILNSYIGVGEGGGGAQGGGDIDDVDFFLTHGFVPTDFPGLQIPLHNLRLPRDQKGSSETAISRGGGGAGAGGRGGPGGRRRKPGSWGGGSRRSHRQVVGRGSGEEETGVEHRDESTVGREGVEEDVVEVVWLSEAGVEGQLRKRLMGLEGRSCREVVMGRVEEEIERLSEFAVSRRGGVLRMEEEDEEEVVGVREKGEERGEELGWNLGARGDCMQGMSKGVESMIECRLVLLRRCRDALARLS